MPSIDPFGWSARPRTIAVFALLVALKACAVPGERVFVAPTRDTVHAELGDVVRGTRPLFIHNQSSIPITVTGVTLTFCDNIRTLCDLHSMEVVIEPNRRMRVLSIAVEDPTRPHRVRYRWTWTYDPSLVPDLSEL